jgi:hypothetical protein
MDDAAMGAVALDGGGWIAFLALGVLVAIAVVRAGAAALLPTGHLTGSLLI